MTRMILGLLAPFIQIYIINLHQTMEQLLVMHTYNNLKSNNAHDQYMHTIFKSLHESSS